MRKRVPLELVEPSLLLATVDGPARNFVAAGVWDAAPLELRSCSFRRPSSSAAAIAVLLIADAAVLDDQGKHSVGVAAQMLLPALGPERRLGRTARHFARRLARKPKL